MNIYISWFGEPSHKVAHVLKEWFPLLIQSVHPYVPVGHLDERAPLGSGLEQSIDEASFGILCVTRDNLDALWLNFEAGAVVRTLGRSRVYVFLLGIDRLDVHGPLSQFPLITASQDDVRRLVGVVNEACGADGLGKPRIDRLFDLLWPDLEVRLQALSSSSEQAQVAMEPSLPVAVDTVTLEILQEILSSVRGLQQGLETPAPAAAARPSEELFQFAESWKDGNQDFLSAIDMELTQIIERLELASQHGEPSSAERVLDEILPTLTRLRGWIRNRSKRLAHGYQRPSGSVVEPPSRMGSSEPAEERRSAGGGAGTAVPQRPAGKSVSGSTFPFGANRVSGGRLKLVRDDDADAAPDQEEQGGHPGPPDLTT